MGHGGWGRGGVHEIHSVGWTTVGGWGVVHEIHKVGWVMVGWGHEIHRVGGSW